MDSLDNPSSPLNLSPGFPLASSDGNAAAAKHRSREIWRPGVCHPHFKDVNAKMGVRHQLLVPLHTQHLQLLPPSQKYPFPSPGHCRLGSQGKKQEPEKFMGHFPAAFICYRIPSIPSQPSPSLTNLHKILPLVGCLQSCGQTPARFLIPALCPRRKEETEMKTW